MYCSYCKQTLIPTGKVFLCPQKHGALVTGNFLLDVKENNLVDKVQTNDSLIDTRHIITCPHCSKKMHKVNYNHTGIMIDACTSCHYRWLDNGEINKIKNFKPKFNADDLLLLNNLALKTAALDSSNRTDPNQKIPLFNIARIVSVGDSRRTLGAISGMALYGIITGMLKSKFLRIVIPLMILFFALGYYIVIKQSLQK